jgi:LPXTG-motif cell wall-anchored protein
MMKRAMALALVLVGLMAAPAAAQQYPPVTNIITASATCPTPGETLTVSAQTFAPGAEVTVSLESTPTVLGTTTANGDGVATLEVTIPAAATSGAHTITAVGLSSAGTDVGATLDLNAAITVCAPEGAAPGEAAGSLPRTGDDTSIPLAKIGLALAALGGILTALAAKRRKHGAVAA